MNLNRPTMTPDDDKPSLLERLSTLLLREPQDREQLVELLQKAHEHNLIDGDALSMIEGVLQVADLSVRDIMVPRARMDVIDATETPDRFIPLVMATARNLPDLMCGSTPERMAEVMSMRPEKRSGSIGPRPL